MPRIDYVTETQDELFEKAEKDLMSIDILCKDTVYPIDRKYDIICFHATQAVEKFLKGYIIENGKKVKKVHNLAFLLENAIAIDSSFKQIVTECLLLNQYTAEIKYTSRKPITHLDIEKALTAVKIISSFNHIKSLRDLIGKKQRYTIITEITTKSAHGSTDRGS